MRCPKCGYNSFDHLDSCKKCGKDLVEFKQNFGIKSVLFPGQMNTGDAEEVEFDSAAADAAVSVATGATAAATVAAASGTDADVEAGGPDRDEFGFDFMGDSADDDDLSFDELFEEAPEDEDIEETIEAPREDAVEPEPESGDDFSFDLPDEEAELEDNFGFDPVSEADGSGDGDDFSFDDEPDPANESDSSGSEEDPNRPFDLPESSQVVGAPEARPSLISEPAAVPKVVEEISDGVTAGADSVVPEEESPEHYVFEPDEFAADSVEKLEPVDEVETVAPEPPPLDVEVTTTAHVSPSVPESVTEEIPVRVPSAPSFGSCIGAFVFDLALLVTVGISFVVAAEAAMSTGETRLLPSLETLVDLSVPYFLVLFFLAFGYFTLFHFLAGQTPGKMLTGLRVETTEGEPLAFAQAFLRSVGGLLQLLPAGLGYLVILTNSERRGWNDRLAGTQVVTLRSAS